MEEKGGKTHSFQITEPRCCLKGGTDRLKARNSSFAPQKPSMGINIEVILPNETSRNATVFSTVRGGEVGNRRLHIQIPQNKTIEYVFKTLLEKKDTIMNDQIYQ
jgi:hypothetical protein